MLIGADRSITIQTRRGWPIPNVQEEEVLPYHREHAEEFIHQTLGLNPTTLPCRRAATATYNCHGMTFACRRTSIIDVAAVKKIMKDDGYRKVTASRALPGDVVLYFESEDVLAHSGIVVGVDQLPGGTARLLTVLSKWGLAGEYVHALKECPYPRVTKIWIYRDASDDSTID